MLTTWQMLLPAFIVVDVKTTILSSIYWLMLLPWWLMLLPLICRFDYITVVADVIATCLKSGWLMLLPPNI